MGENSRAPTVILILAILFIIIGFVLTVIFGEKALNKAFNPDHEHGLFWAGIVCLAGGIGFLIIYIVMKISKIRKLKNANNVLKDENYILNKQLSQCKGGGSTPGSSGPGFFSRLGSKIGGFFRRNTSVPAAGNPGEENPFLKEQ